MLSKCLASNLEPTLGSSDIKCFGEVIHEDALIVDVIPIVVWQVTKVREVPLIYGSSTLGTMDL